MDLRNIWQKLRGQKERSDTSQTAGVQEAEEDQTEMKTEVLQKHIEERDDPEGPPGPPTDRV